MSENSKRQNEERIEKVMEVGEKQGELQQEKEPRNHPGHKEATSGSMLARGATMSVSSDPENTESEESADEEEFILVPLPPQLVPGHFEDLEDALICLDLKPPYQIVSRDMCNGDNSDDHNEKKDSSRDSSDNLSLDDPANDAYTNEHVEVQEQRMHTGDFHLSNLQIKLEHNYTNPIEKNGIVVEGKDGGEEVHKESEGRNQWEDPEVPPPGSTLYERDTGSASSDPEDNESEGRFDIEFFLAPLSPSFVPDQLEDFEDDYIYPSFPAEYQIRSNWESHVVSWVEPEQGPGCIFPSDLCLCRLC